MKINIYLCCRLIPAFLLILLFSSVSSAQVYADKQVNGVTGLCLLCGVTNPGNAVNNTSQDDYALFSITAGLLNVSVYETLIFPAPSTSGCDSLIIGIGSGEVLLSVGVLSAITVQTFNGSTPNNDSVLISSNILRLLQSNNRGEIVLKPQQTFDRVKVTMHSSLVGLLNAFRLYYAYRKPALAPPVITPSAPSVCSGDSVTLSAAAPPGAVIQWYNAATGGTVIRTGATLRVSPASTTTYYASAGLNNCISTRSAVTVTVNPRPAKPVFTVPQGHACGSQQITITNHTNGVNYEVNLRGINLNTVVLDTTFVVQNSAVFYTPNIIIPGPGDAFLTIRAVYPVTGCRSDSVQQLYRFGGSGRYPTTDADSVNICFGQQATLHAYNPFSAITQMHWYDAPSGGNLLFIGNYFTVAPAVTTVYYVANRLHCEYPVRRPMKVTVTKLATPQFSVPQTEVCNGFKTIIQNHTPGIQYSVRIRVTDPFSVLLTDTTFISANKDTLAVPTLMAPYTADVALFVQAFHPVTGCKSDTAKMTYTTGATGSGPVADADSVSICRGDSATLRAVDPLFSFTTILWYNAPTGGTLLRTGSTFKVSPATTTTYYVTTAISCENPRRKPVKVIVSSCGATISKTNMEPLHIYPNPSDGILKLNGPTDIAGSIVVILDMYGRTVHQETLQGRTLELKGKVKPGMYLIRLITGKGKQYTGKFILL